MKQKYIIAIIIAIVLIGGVYFYISNRQVSAPDNSSITNATQNNPDTNFKGDVPNDSNTANPTVPTSDTIAVSTQLAGDSITIDNAYLEKPGFITIHEIDSKGNPGTVIGVSGLLETGAKQDLEIKATVKAGGKYIAMLRIDNGDKKFDSTKDIAAKKNNIQVMTMFSVSQ